MNPLLNSIPHDHVVILLIQIAILLGVARLFGEIASRVGQPAVVGELLAGIVLGPSLLGTLFPMVGNWVNPQSIPQGHLLQTVGLLGAMLLLLCTGLEINPVLIRRHGRIAIGAATGGLILPFATGLALGLLLPDALLTRPDTRVVFALFMATAMSISAIPVIAKVLMDMGLIRHEIGQTIIVAGIIDDTVGWILLSLVAGLVGGQAITLLVVLGALAKVGILMLVSFTLGRWLVLRLFRWMEGQGTSNSRLLTLILVLTCITGAITHALHLEAVLGAFITGILVGQVPGLNPAIREQIESVTMGWFAPLFFALAGLKVNLLVIFGDMQLLLVALAVIAVAIFGKVLGAYVGARTIGRQSHWRALTYGAGLNARGAMEIIVATMGLSLGILSQPMFSSIVLMAMVTSLMTPAALRWTLRRGNASLGLAPSDGLLPVEGRH